MSRQRILVVVGARPEAIKLAPVILVRTVIDYPGPYPDLDGLILRSTDSIGAAQVRHDERAEGRSNYTPRC